ELFAETYNELKTKNPFSNEIINAIIIQILYSVIRSTYDGFIDSKKLSSIESDNTFAKILIYLDRNISNDISLDQMAQFTHLEKVYFLKKFKKLTELTPMKYLKAIRMKKAKTLLQYSDMSITQVAESVGFKNIQYFSKVFKEYNQINPSSYRSKFVTKR
ncbi:MAG: AraC family transcriptional regulator, partial [Clostridia bacterium]